jgi:hypothetical protein
MIGMIAYAILGGFILIAVFISNRLVKIFGWSLSPNKLFLLRAGVFFGIFFILFFDHIIDMIQFEYVCHLKTETKLAADWKDVKRAGLALEENLSFGRLGYTVPILCAKMKYQDLDTGKIFLSYTYCRMKWGFLARNLAVNNTSTSFCFPKDARNIDHMVNIGNLLEKGKSQ